MRCLNAAPIEQLAELAPEATFLLDYRGAFWHKLPFLVAVDQVCWGAHQSAVEKRAVVYVAIGNEVGFPWCF